MSNSPDSANTPPTIGGASSGKVAPGRNRNKVVAATIAIIATLAASGAAVAVNLGASEPPLDPAAGQLAPTAAATSAERVTTAPTPAEVDDDTARNYREGDDDYRGGDDDYRGGDDDYRGGDDDYRGGDDDYREGDDGHRGDHDDD